MENKEFLTQQLMWIVISIGISITISWFVPFPLSWVVIIGVFLVLSFYMRYRMMKKMGSGGGMFGSLSSPFSGNSVRGNFLIRNHSTIKISKSKLNA